MKKRSVLGEGRTRDSIFTFSTVVILTAFVIALSSGPAVSQQGVGPPDAAAKEAFKSILSSADADKDGKLSIRECFAIRKDRKTAEKNCRSWNADDDGRMTQDGYVRQS
ncbi:MAG TPA: hypothetical protein P5551_06880 [Syntrophales bacterium]|nr:hypothetical protein [Syntrophales bacterium]HRT62066.1 hypothetical protein [Syntrophales bacterium]